MNFEKFLYYFGKMRLNATYHKKKKVRLNAVVNRDWGSLGQLVLSHSCPALPK
jgi:hypothetical protein